MKAHEGSSQQARAATRIGIRDDRRLEKWGVDATRIIVFQLSDWKTETQLV